MAQNCHGKTKTLTAKAITSRQKQIPHDKTKYFRAKANTSRQKQILHGKRKYLTANANASQQRQKQIHVTDLGGWKPGTQGSRKECRAEGKSSMAAFDE